MTPEKRGTKPCGSSPANAKCACGGGGCLAAAGSPAMPSMTGAARDRPRRGARRWRAARRPAPIMRRQLRDVAEQLGELAGRQPVGLGEDQVERDRARAGALQGVDDRGELRARPRPLPDAWRAKPRRCRRCARAASRIERPRRNVEVAVEDREPQPRDRLGIGDAHGDRQQTAAPRSRIRWIDGTRRPMRPRLERRRGPLRTRPS